MKYKKSIVFKCPYCNITTDREALVKHIEKEHSDMIPEGYTAARVVFNYINHKDGGQCVVCGKSTQWNEKLWKYSRLCGNPACKQHLSDMADKNMMRVYNTTTKLNDPEHQEKMLRGRSISGTYKFKDGGSFDYVGSYEKKCLEFMDIVLDIPSVDIMTPGPVIEYMFEGKKHNYISDIYYIPANLIIEVKDGGSNPNNRSMTSYRAKQTAKEKEVAKLGTYNYIRLTNNNFEQLFEILSEIKYNMIVDEDSTPIMRIHEVFDPRDLKSDRDMRLYEIEAELKRIDAKETDYNTKTGSLVRLFGSVLYRYLKFTTNNGSCPAYNIPFGGLSEILMKVIASSKYSLNGTEKLVKLREEMADAEADIIVYLDANKGKLSDAQLKSIKEYRSEINKCRVEINKSIAKTSVANTNTTSKQFIESFFKNLNDMNRSDETKLIRTNTLTKGMVKKWITNKNNKFADYPIEAYYFADVTPATIAKWYEKDSHPSTLESVLKYLDPDGYAKITDKDKQDILNTFKGKTLYLFKKSDTEDYLFYCVADQKFYFFKGQKKPHMSMSDSMPFSGFIAISKKRCLENDPLMNLYRNKDSLSESYIDEEVGGMPRQGSTDAIYVVQYGNNSSSFSGKDDGAVGYAITKEPTSKYIIARDDKDSKLKIHNTDTFLRDKKFSIYETAVYNRKGYMKVLSECNKNVSVGPNHIMETLYNKSPIVEDTIKFDTRFTPIDLAKVANDKAIIEATFDISNNASSSIIVAAGKSMSIKRDKNGYYASANGSMYRSPYFNTVKELHDSNTLSSLLSIISEEVK